MRLSFFVIASLVCFVGCEKSPVVDNTQSQVVVPEQRDETGTNGIESDDSDEPISGGNDNAASQPVAFEEEDSKTQSDGSSQSPTSRPPLPLTVQQYGEIFVAKEFVEELSLGEKVYVSFGGDSTVLSKRPPKELQELCRGKLTENGWNPVFQRSFDLTAGAKREEFHFEKNGHYLSVATSGPDETGTQMSVKSLGNVDMRKLPVAESFQLDENASFTYAGYTTDDEIGSATEFCRQRMADLGWTEFTCTSSPSCLPHPQAPNQVVAFCQAGFSFYVTVGRYPGFKDGKTVVSYVATGILPVDLLIVDDAVNLKLEVLHGKAAYHSKRSATDLRKAIASHFEKLDYPLIDGAGKETFIDIYRSGEGEQVLVDITPLDDGTTSVQLIRQFEK